ncbi:MAG: hypothetical protein RLZZ308_181 [Candidatus Parcubacteria bacterium]|jgi:protein-disulfide isomerase
MNIVKHSLKVLSSKLTSFTKSTPSAIIIAALLLSMSHIAYGFIVQNGQSSQSLQIFAGAPISDDLLTGKTKSDIIVVEYSDTECPFCAQLQPTIKKIQEEYASKVAFAYRYFPLTQIHPNAFDEAKAIHCVGKLSGAEKRRAYINTLFDTKLSRQNMTLQKGEKERFAKETGVDEASFTSCMSDTSTDTAVTNSMQDGINAGVQGTPATFVLKRDGSTYEVIGMIDGARPYEYFKAVLEEALK